MNAVFKLPIGPARAAGIEALFAVIETVLGPSMAGATVAVEITLDHLVLTVGSSLGYDQVALGDLLSLEIQDSVSFQLVADRA